MPTWLLDINIKWLAAWLAAIVISACIYAKGRHDVQVKFDAYKVEVQAAAEAQAKEAARVDARNAKLFKDAQNAYNTSLANLRAYYKLRNNGLSPMPQVPGTAAGANDTTANDIPALPPVATIAAQCAETTLMLTSLQKWIADTASVME